MTTSSPAVTNTPRPWFTSIRAKITLPYALLAILLALAAAYVITQLIVDSVQERFVNQLLESGRLVADRVVGLEQENRAALREMVYTEGVAAAVSRGDRETLDRLLYPLAVNRGVEAVEILDRSGAALLSLRHRAGGGPADYDRAIVPVAWGSYPFVARVLAGESDAQGDKFIGLAAVPWGDTLYTAGPIYDGETLVGVALVGRYLAGLPNDLRQASAAHQVTLYTLDGAVLVTSLPAEERAALALTPEQAGRALADQDTAVRVRRLQPAGGRSYQEVLGPLEVRGGEDIGLFGAALAETYLVQASPITQIQLALLVAVTLVAVVGIGTVIAQRISRPILEVARASRQVAAGNLEQRVQVRTRDEVEDLAQAFNKMLEDLKQAQRVRDIFGRAVSPEVSRVLIEATEKGEISLTGECRVVTTLFTDIRGFTTLAEDLPPDQVLVMLNEVLGAFIAVIEKHEGVVNKFGGDSLLAIFGAPMAQPDHARRAVAAGLDMIRRLRALNEQRRTRGLEAIEAGIGINTGEVVAGLTGSAARLEYTVIGDPVNVTARIQSLARQHEGRVLFITESTVQALGPDHGLDLEDLGPLPLRGKSEPVRVYAVRG